VIAISLTACATNTPYAEIDGQGAGRAQSDEADIRIVGTDGKIDSRGATSAVVAPGGHYFLVASTRVGRRGRDNTQTLPLMMAPCTRYKIAARHGSSMKDSDWEVVIKSEESIPECLSSAQMSPR